MTTHSSTLAWKIPWMEEPGRLQPMRSQRVRHYRETSLSLSLYTLPGVSEIVSRKLLYNTGSSDWCSVMTQRGRIGVDGRAAQGGGDIPVLIADSHCSMAETNTTL